MSDASVLERVKFLQLKLTRIQAANQVFFDKPFHKRSEIEAHERRAGRLHDILDELARLEQKTKAA